MTKATMPDPVAYIRSSSMLSPSPRCVASLAYVSQIDQERGELYEPVITTTQAEAYADARVREALEEAAQIAEGEEFQDEHGRPSRKGRTCGTWHEDSPVGGVTRAIAGAIRAMIPKEAKS